MRASETLLLDFIRQSPQLLMPVNQRRYAWTRREWGDLWEHALDGGERDDVREHFLGPELVAERIVRLAELVGRENVIGSTDCGFAQGPFHRRVHPTVQWAKPGALVEGARLASEWSWA